MILLYVYLGVAGLLLAVTLLERSVFSEREKERREELALKAMLTIIWPVLLVRWSLDLFADAKKGFEKSGLHSSRKN